MAGNILQVEDLRVEYGSAGARFPVLDGVSFSLAGGEAAGILGASGCGKTTLLLTLLGLLPASARVVGGSVRFRGRQLLHLGDRAFQHIRGAQIALIPQEPALALSPFIRVGEQVADVLQAHRSASRRECRQEAARLLATVGLADVDRLYRSYPHQLSGGQRQRVVLAQAIACRPGLLLADEPTSSLDTISQAGFISLLRRLQQELRLGVLFVSHDSALLSEVASRILVFDQGRVVDDGSAKEVLSRPGSRFARDLLDSFAGRLSPLAN